MAERKAGPVAGGAASAGGAERPAPGTTPMAALADELGYPRSVTCPFCGGTETELHSPFGSGLSVATYWCRGCRTAFEWIKWG